MKATTILTLIASFTFGCAGTQVARPTQHASALRGTVVLDGPAVKAVVVGPSTIHAYSAYAGGSIFTAPVVSGTDSDCSAAVVKPTDQLGRLQPDHIAEFDVAAGRVACLATGRAGSFELLWHASRQPADGAPASATLAAE